MTTLNQMTNNTHTDIQALGEQVTKASEPFTRLKESMHSVIVGQDKLLHRMFIGLLANGHLLIEGVPGLAKTLAVSSLAKGINTSFQRLQFTPDLLPADLTGTLMYRQDTGEFVVNKGPIFSSIILADEINRAPAKVQSALLEAMQERQVTIGKETFKMADPFLVLATMNPIEQEGTYPLPEAQVDRFMMKVLVDYPTAQEEREILRRMATTTQDNTVECVMQPDAITNARELVDQIYVDDQIADYIVELVQMT
ncbi:MAG: AAA family ATPase, partial [Phycisphaerales bacterium]|nr:AAA family ATPase [Phycisphaerales bacterium]